MNFIQSEFSLGRQRCRQWISLVTQQLRLRHIYQIYGYNLQSDKRANFYFTLHNTPMSSPFYTSEKIQSKNPKWDELAFKELNTNISSVVIRIWKSSKNGDEILLTWGVNFSGLVYLSNKLADLQPKYFKPNTVIFFMQGGYFSSQEYLQTNLQQPLPFQNVWKPEEKGNYLEYYKRMIPKSEVQSSYTIEKLRRLQELQRLIKKKKDDVQEIKEKIKNATEYENKSELYDPAGSSYSNNIRFVPQLLTMNSLNKMLHEKPTKVEREEMSKLNKKIEIGRCRVRLLNQEKDRMSVSLRKLKQRENKFCEQNEEKNSNLMSLYHILSKETQRFEECKQNLTRRKEFLLHINKQLYHRKKQLLKELLFIYPIEKIANENKYTMLGIYLPDSEVLTDYHDPGISVVLGYVCHILIMCSIFLQVPLRYPMRHFGSRSVIYDQVSAMIPDKEREFPLYTKGRDRAHFSYAVFLLNKNLSQLRWYLYHWYTLDLKETLKHLLNFLLGKDMTDSRFPPSHEGTVKRDVPKTNDRLLTSDESTSTLTAESVVSLDKLVSVPLSSTSSSNLNDPIIDRMLEEIRAERRKIELTPTRSPTKKLSIFKLSPKQNRNEPSTKGSSEVLALPEAYLNKQISKDLFHRCASGGYNFSEKSDGSNQSVSIKVKDGVEEIRVNSTDRNGESFDSIEQGTDPLDPSTNLDSIITRSININTDQTANQNIDFLKRQRISRSVDSYPHSELNSPIKPTFGLGSDPLINVSCDKSSDKKKTDTPGSVQVGNQHLLERWLSGDTSIASSNEMLFPEECLRVSFQDISSPLTARTDRLLSTNQSFNLEVRALTHAAVCADSAVESIADSAVESIADSAPSVMVLDVLRHTPLSTPIGSRLGTSFKHLPCVLHAVSAQTAVCILALNVLLVFV